MSEKLINVKELAEKLGVSRSKIYVLINDGLPFIKIGSSTRFDYSEVMAWIKEKQGQEVKK